MRFTGVAAVLLFSIPTFLHAEPLNLRQVSATAKWVAHVDVDMMRSSQAFQKAYPKAADEWYDIFSQLERLNAEFGLNLENGLHSITVYGNQLGNLSGVLLANVEVDQIALESGMTGATGYQASKHRTHTLHSWSDEHGPMTGVFYTPKQLLFARSTEEVTAALDVLDGKSPSLEGKNSTLAASIPAGAFFVGRAIALANAELPWQSPLVKQSESLNVALGLKDDKVFFEGQLTAKSVEAASQFKDLIQGGRAMVLLHLPPTPELTKLLDAVKITVKDKSVSVDFRASVDEVWAEAEKAYEKW